MAPIIRYALAALLAAAEPARCAQFAVPVHQPPSVWPEQGTSFKLALGWVAARASGLAVDGPGGGWEFAGASSGGGISAHLHSHGFLLSGHGDPLGAARRRATGMAGGIEGNIAWAPRGAGDPLRVYTGGIVSLTVLSFMGAGSIRFSNNAVRVEPDTATSIVLGAPLGVRSRWSSGRSWDLDASAYVVAWAGGATFFSYGPAGPFGLGRSRRVDPSVGGGAEASVEFKPWRLSAAAGAALTAPSGGNETLRAGWARLAFRFF